MCLLKSFNDQNIPSFGKNWSMFLIWGIVLFLLGILAVSATTLTTMITVTTLGFIIFLSGIVITVDSFSSWRGKWGGFLIHFIVGLLYLAVGVMLIKNPLQASISLTLLLGIFYIIAGVFRLIISMSVKMPRWGWNWLNGLITLLLGILIITSWPASSLFFIGLFVGVDLLFCGWAYIMTGIAARRFAKQMR